MSAYFTFVAIDEHNNPVAVPDVVPETKEEKQRYEAAQLRKRDLLRTRKRLKELRAGD